MRHLNVHYSSNPGFKETTSRFLIAGCIFRILSLRILTRDLSSQCLFAKSSEFKNSDLGFGISLWDCQIPSSKILIWDSSSWCAFAKSWARKFWFGIEHLNVDLPNPEFKNSNLGFVISMCICLITSWKILIWDSSSQCAFAKSRIQKFSRWRNWD